MTEPSHSQPAAGPKAQPQARADVLAEPAQSFEAVYQEVEAAAQAESAPPSADPMAAVTSPALRPIAPLPAQASRNRPFLGPIEWLALALSLVWLAIAVLFWGNTGGDAGSTGLPSNVLAIVAVILPVVLIWVAAITARTAREMRSEAEDLKAVVETMRSAWISQQQSRSGQTLERRLDEVARQAETALASFTSRRDVTQSQPSADHKAAFVNKPSATGEDQPALALGTPAEALAEPVSVADFVRALNFPDNADDHEGFRALRRALDDRTMAKLIRASQDVLNLLAQDGIYMDDMHPDRSRPELWRRFAQGERGREIAQIGTVRDRSAHTLATGRMRSDAVFRDAAHHFLRQFDRTFSSFEKNASDQEIADLAETRTARAFLLLGRVTGMFD